MLPIVDKRNIKENKKLLRFGLTLDSIQWHEEHEQERETNSLRTKTCFHSIAKELKEERVTNSLRTKTYF